MFTSKEYFYPLILYTKGHQRILKHDIHYLPSCAHRFATSTSVQRESRIAPMRRICSFTDFYLMHLDYVRYWRMDFYGFCIRLRQSSAVRRNEIRYKSKSKRNP